MAHFSLSELVRSREALRRGIDNRAPASVLLNLCKTIEMLDGIRETLTHQAGRDVPILISSGYRSPALNWAVRNPNAGPGVDPSGDHPRGMAADWTAPAFGTPLEICRALAPQVGVLGIGQLIYEGTWVHTSWAMPLRAVNRVITKVAKGYVPGIVEAS